MAYYIKGLPLYTVLIGITSYDPYLSLTQNAKSALIAIGANLTGMQRESKLCFVAQIGQPAMSVSKMASPGGFNLNITVNVAGIYEYHCIYRILIELLVECLCYMLLRDMMMALLPCVVT